MTDKDDNDNHDHDRNAYPRPPDSSDPLDLLEQWINIGKILGFDIDIDGSMWADRRYWDLDVAYPAEERPIVLDVPAELRLSPGEHTSFRKEASAAAESYAHFCENGTVDRSQTGQLARDLRFAALRLRDEEDIDATVDELANMIHRYGPDPDRGDSDG